MVGVLGVTVTPEQFATQGRSRAQAFAAAARVNAESADSVGALACGWAADLATVQSVLADAILVAREAPQRAYFQTVAGVVNGLDASWSAEPGAAAGLGLTQVLHSARGALVRTLEPAVVAQLSDDWTDLAPLSEVAAPTVEQLESDKQRRLAGMDVQTFVPDRRATAARMALAAAHELEQGQTQRAVESAYRADMLAVEAYLVLMASKATDRYLLTARAEWDVVMNAIRGMTSLPSEFSAAVHAVRNTFLTALGEPHATRVQPTLPNVVP